MGLTEKLEGTDAPRAQRTIRWHHVTGYAFALACLAWVFHDVNLADLGAHLGGVQWGWVALAVVADILSYLCQAWRWQLLLRSTGRLSVMRAAQAIYAGLFTNEILPLRVGELVRMYFASRWLAAPFLSVVPSIAVERLFDGIWLAVCIGLTAILVPLPRNLLEAADVLGIGMLVATVAFVAIIFRQRKRLKQSRAAEPQHPEWLKKLRSGLAHLGEGMAQIGISRSFYASFALSFLVLLLQAVAFWLTMVAYGLQLSFWPGFAVLLIVHLGTAIPNAPANVGSYQFFAVVGLLLFGVDKTLAAGFSVFVFVVLTIPLWALGWLAISRSGMKMVEIRDQVRSLAVRQGAARQQEGV